MQHREGCQQIEILSRLAEREACIGIIGLGYVGLPLAVRFCQENFKVIGFDIDNRKVDKLNSGLSYIGTISSREVSDALSLGFVATSDYKEARLCDALIICVPTPLNRCREPDISYIIDSTDAILPYLREGQVISLESTTWPGTTEEILRPRIESTGLIVGKSIYLVFSPEREDPGNPNYSTKTIPKVVGGSTKICGIIGKALYGSVIDDVVLVGSSQVAEMSKLLENIYRAVNIGLVNELKIICDKMSIDIHEVIKAASTKPFGFTPYYPGPGLGGHCIPIDPFYLTWKAREFGISTRFIELAGEVNTNMTGWVVGKISDALNHMNKPVKNANILVLGIAYKKNIDDTRESPAVEILKLLEERGASISYSDPYVPVLPPMRKYKFDLKSVELTRELLASSDCVVIVADHDLFDYDLIQNCAPLVVDTRGRFARKYANVVHA